MSEKRMKLTIAIGDADEYITIKTTPETAEGLKEAVMEGSWIVVRDEWGFRYLINPRYVAYLKWREEAEGGGE